MAQDILEEAETYDENQGGDDLWITYLGISYGFNFRQSRARFSSKNLRPKVHPA